MANNNERLQSGDSFKRFRDPAFAVLAGGVEKGGRAWEDAHPFGATAQHFADRMRPPPQLTRSPAAK